MKLYVVRVPRPPSLAFAALRRYVKLPAKGHSTMLVAPLMLCKAPSALPLLHKAPPIPSLLLEAPSTLTLLHEAPSVP